MALKNSNPFIDGAPSQAPLPGVMTAGNNGTFEVDITNVKEGFQIPAGIYKARCVDVTQEVSKTGNPMFVWVFTIVEGNQAGRDFKQWTAITPAAMWKVAETVIALGIGQTGQVVKFKREDVLNKECGIVIEDDEYNGQAKSKITRVVPLQELTSQKK